MALLRGEHRAAAQPVLAPCGLALLRPDFASSLGGDVEVAGVTVQSPQH